MALLASSRLVPLWQLLLLGLGSFWGGMYVMAVKWAGVPTGQLSLSRVAPMMVLSLELLCTGGLSLTDASAKLVCFVSDYIGVVRGYTGWRPCWCCHWSCFLQVRVAPTLLAG
jgi:hypothetical protein